MRGDNRSHVLHSAVGDFHITPIEEFRIGMVLGKVLGDEAEELGGYVGRNIFIVGRVEPNYISLTLPSRSYCLISGRGGSGRVLMTTSLQGVFVCR